MSDETTRICRPWVMPRFPVGITFISMYKFTLTFTTTILITIMKDSLRSQRGSRAPHRMRKGALGIALVVGLISFPFPPSARAAAASTDEPLAALVQVLSQSSDTSLQLDVLRGIKAGLQGSRSIAMPAGWPALEAKLGASPNSEIRLTTYGLGLLFGSTTAVDSMRKLLADSAAAVQERRIALSSLSQTKDAQLPAVLQRLLGEAPLRADALKSLAGFNDAGTPAAILSHYTEFGISERRDALNTLASRLTYAKPLIEALSAHRIPKDHLTAELVRQLHNLKDPGIDAELEKLWGVMRETNADKKKEIEKYRNIFRAGGSTPGDAPRGRKVFARVCQQCHTLFDTGGKVGPDLTGSNRADLEYILSNMVDPNAVIPNDYRTSTIEMKDDRILTGIVKQQDDRNLTVVTANEILVLPRNEVRAVQVSALSMMPEGLLTPLTDQEVRDLIYYLSRPGQVEAAP